VSARSWSRPVGQFWMFDFPPHAVPSSFVRFCGLFYSFLWSVWLCWLVGFGSWARRPVAAASLVDLLCRFVASISLVRLCGVFFPFGFLLLCCGPWGMFSFVFTFTLCVGRLCIVVCWSSRLRLQHRTRLSLLRHRRNRFFSYRDEHLLTRTGVGCGVWRDGRGVGKGWSASAVGRVSDVLGAESTQMWMRLV